MRFLILSAVVFLTACSKQGPSDHVFVPIAEADTIEELEEKLKPSLFTRIKKWIRRIL